MTVEKVGSVFFTTVTRNYSNTATPQLLLHCSKQFWESGFNL